MTTASVPLTDKTPKKIAGMFDQIAGRYDLLNTVLSGGMDRYWRARAVRSLRLTGRERALDVCTGPPTWRSRWRGADVRRRSSASIFPGKCCGSAAKR